MENTEKDDFLLNTLLFGISRPSSLLPLSLNVSLITIGYLQEVVIVVKVEQWLFILITQVVVMSMQQVLVFVLKKMGNKQISIVFGGCQGWRPTEAPRRQPWPIKI